MTTLAWHFAPDNNRTRYTDEPIVVGEWLSAEGPIKLCRNGMHASKRLIDALQYAPGAMLARVEVDGEIKEGDDKIAGRRRRVLWQIDATNLLHEFACRCAEDALARAPNPDPRSIAAIQAKRDWLAGKINDTELQAAYDVAYYAAYDAAYDAAYAAYYAARAAVSADATYAATYAAYYATEKYKQNRRLTSMVIAQAKKEGVYR